MSLFTALLADGSDDSNPPYGRPVRRNSSFQVGRLREGSITNLGESDGEAQPGGAGGRELQRQASKRISWIPTVVEMSNTVADFAHRNSRLRR